MNKTLAQLDAVVSQLVAGDKTPTAEGIRATISAMRISPMFSDIIDEEAEALARELEERIGISMGLGAVVGEHDFRPWLADARATGTFEPYYWERYKRLLVSKRLPGDVITSTDLVTDRILDRMGNPRDESSWDRKGMVVGHVQSGKTANYTGLVCKAADAGYRLIIVIAGIHNNLRNQTQARIDEGFIGRDTGRLEKKDTRHKPKVIGVGTFDDRRAPVSLTTTLKDFNKATATTNTSQIGSYSVPVVLVIKKNYSTLNSLIDWLKEHSASRGSQMVDQPMLLIDDEADNASINIEYGKDEVSRINGQIRNLLGLFRRSCYVGYTATPFANIFIDPDIEGEVYGQDLFPRHFIIGLDAPTNYFGARKVFIDGVPDSDEGEPAHLRYIIDHADLLPVKHKIDHSVGALPPSMIDALRTFMVARAIRNIRGQRSQHASMLVNASRFTGIQNAIRNRLHEHLKNIEAALRVDGALRDAAERNAEIGEIRRVFEAQYPNCGCDWHSVLEQLLPVAAGTTVIAVNTSSPGSLDYDVGGENGLTVIAVGGFSLSRGLTLEGLTVSYFLRNSLMYDTLMQMGRWFGYRPNYEDLCRIWMLEDAASWYAFIGEATEELQRDLKRMEQANATPDQFGLAVRSHPSALMVTARNKLGSGTKSVMVGLSNNFVETTKLSITGIERNRSARERLLGSLSAEGKDMQSAAPVSGGHLLTDISVRHVDDFLREFDNERESVLTDTRPIRQYIADRSVDELARWDILLAGKADESTSPLVTGGWSVRPISRSVGADDLPRGILSISGKRARVASRGMERAGVADTVADAAEAAYRKEKNIPEGQPVNYPDHIYRGNRTRPLLILFTIIIKPPEAGQHAKFVPEGPVVGWGISFPVSGRPDERVEYILNTVKLRELFGEDETDEGELDDAA
jgi:hypothetical protein